MKGKKRKCGKEESGTGNKMDNKKLKCEEKWGISKY
jgi:hypothetical protein